MGLFAAVVAAPAGAKRSRAGLSSSVPSGSIYKRSVDGMMPGNGGGAGAGGGGNRRSLDLPALSSSMPGWS
jgi:hypothetical protein